MHRDACTFWYDRLTAYFTCLRSRGVEPTANAFRHGSKHVRYSARIAGIEVVLWNAHRQTDARTYTQMQTRKLLLWWFKLFLLLSLSVWIFLL